MVSTSNVVPRIVGKYRRSLARFFCRRMAPIRAEVPIISFTFDDAPGTALAKGAEVLGSHGIRATYYVSLGLLGSETAPGVIATREELLRAAGQGHELGCHTFHHLGAWETDTRQLMDSVRENTRALSDILPGARFRTFAYPKSQVRPSCKRRLGRLFDCCRGGGQTFNAGMTDLNLLKAFFIDRRYSVEMRQVARLIDLNAQCGGWLIFATHDVSPAPSLYGCTPELLADIAGCAVSSGALLLPVAEAFDRLWPGTSSQARSSGPPTHP